MSLLGALYTKGEGGGGCREHYTILAQKQTRLRKAIIIIILNSTCCTLALKDVHYEQLT